MPIRPRSGQTRCARQRKSWSSSSWLGALNECTSQPWGLTPDITCLIVLSLPPASMPCRISSTAQRSCAYSISCISRRRSRLFSSSFSPWPFEGTPPVSAGSASSRLHRWPFCTRWRSARRVISLKARRVFIPQSSAGASARIAGSRGPRPAGRPSRCPLRRRRGPEYPEPPRNQPGKEAVMSGNTPVASNSLTVRIRLANKPGMLGRIASAIGEAGGDIGAVDVVEVTQKEMTRDVTFKASDEAHGLAVVERLRQVPDVTVVNVSDRTFLMHLGGKIEVNGRVAVKTRDDLSMAYTPGVARVCMAIHDDPEKVYNLTIKQHTVAVVTDGSAVLGLGDIGPEAALPVMEGKCLIFKSFAGVDAFPIALATKDVDEIVRTVKAISPIFGGINLEDISAPRCFEIEERLQRDLDIPVFHDDQHGTAVVTLAALL